MTDFTIGSSAATSRSGSTTITDSTWRVAALALLSVRFIQGFIYWGGGSRRFIYAPSKLDPHAASWMANKFQSAMPGAVLGTDHLIAFLLHHFYLLYGALILFRLGELVAGVFLMAGLLTRAAALASIGFSIVLMLMFGWQGATCIDEWTMAASNLAMGAALMLAGSGVFSIDNLLLQHTPAMANRGWFRWMAGALPLPLGDRAYAKTALAVLAATVIFNVATYDYYRGSVVSAFHGGPVSPSTHHYTLSNGVMLPNGSVQFHAYLDGGTPAEASHIMQAAVLDSNGKVLELWDTEALGHLGSSDLSNEFAYNRFIVGPYGLVAKMGAEATITLPATAHGPIAGTTTFRLTTVNGNTFGLPLKAG
jgi:thiosulfate dehydrogenase (quinone)